MRFILALVAAIAVPHLAMAQQPIDDDDENGDQQQPYDQQPEADPRQFGVGYFGPHPVPYQYGSGYCNIEGAHSHEYAPFDQYLFREYDGYYYFIGDPNDFGYAGTMYWFNGNHPIPLEYGAGYCYISWQHQHAYAPSGIEGFSQVGGYYTYAGNWSDGYYAGRDFYSNYYGGYYRNSYLGNRYYRVRPSPIYATRSPVRIGAPPGRTFVGMPRPARVGVAIGGGRFGAVGTASPAYRAAPVSSPGYRGAVGAPVYRAAVSSTPTYRSGASEGFRPQHTFSPSSSGFRPADSAPMYRPSPSYRAPAPVFHSVPARVGGFHR